MSSEALVREAQDPATTPARLAELAQADRSTWAAIVFNPSAYEGLLQWLGERGDPTVDAALAARASHAAAQLSPAPPAPPVTPVPSAAETDSEPTQVIPTETDNEPTQVIPAGSSPEPTVAFASAAPAGATASYGSVPPGGAETHPAADGSGNGSKPLAVVIAMVAVIIALIGGAAYGATQVFGGDDAEPVATSTRTTDVPPPSDDATTDSPDDSGDGSSDSGDLDGFCTAMSSVQDATLDGLGGDSSDPSDLQDMAAGMLDAYEDLKDSAPAELQDDVDAMADYIETLQDPLSADPEELSSDMSDYFDSVGRVTQYYAANCL